MLRAELYDDISFVAGLRSGDDVLFVGNVFLPVVKRYVNDVAVARRHGDIVKLVYEGRLFNRIFVTCRVDDPGLIEMLFDLAAEDALFCFLEDNSQGTKGVADITRLREFVETKFPFADVWQVRSNSGPVVMANIDGYSRLGWLAA